MKTFKQFNKEIRHEEQTEHMDEDLKKLAVAGMVAGGLALGGYSGVKNARDISNLEKQHSQLVQTNPKKAEQLKSHIDAAKLTSGNFKLNATTRGHIDAAKELVGK